MKAKKVFDKGVFSCSLGSHILFCDYIQISVPAKIHQCTQSHQIIRAKVLIASIGIRKIKSKVVLKNNPHKL